jgi:hypothetical protein
MFLSGDSFLVAIFFGWTVQLYLSAGLDHTTSSLTTAHNPDTQITNIPKKANGLG